MLTRLRFLLALGLFEGRTFSQHPLTRQGNNKHEQQKHLRVPYAAWVFAYALSAYALSRRRSRSNVMVDFWLFAAQTGLALLCS